MADKRISQLVERTDIANNDVVPIVASGATTTNKATISSIQEFMQENLDLGVTSVGITLGTTGTDVNVTGSPITTSGNITINLPTASATNRGLLSAADWTTFNNKQAAGNYVTLDTAQTITAQKTFTTSGSSDTMIISHGSGSGFALDVIKAGNGEAIRVQKTSGSGNAMTVIGGNFEAPTIVKTGGTSSQFLKANGSVDSSTYLTTSTAASTYVPYTGATGAVDLGTHTLSSNNLIANGGLNAGALLLKNANAASTINTGYLTLSPSSTTTRVTFGFSTGASTWKSLSFSSHLLTDNTPTIFSFPNGGGTLAVTTDLGAYLPLTGGTLTGTLEIGTSAPSIFMRGSNGNVKSIQFANAGGSIHWSLQTALGSAGEQGTFSIRNSVLGQDAILIQPASNNISLTGALNGTSASFTGALNGTSASFTGQVQVNNGQFFNAKRADGAGINVLGFPSGSNNLTSVTPNDYNLQNTGGVNLFSVSSAGAATFSSSVTAGGVIQSNITKSGSGVENVNFLQLRLFGTNAIGDSLDIRYLNSAGNNIANISAILGGDNVAYGSLAFSTRNFNTDTMVEAMRINNRGNVGIGTASPSYRTQISAPKNTTALFVTSNNISSAGDYSEIGFGNLDNGSSVFSAIRSAFENPAASANTSMQFFTNGASYTERMRITSDGYARLSASSGGIQFNGDTAAANALDDYEEGTWTIGFSFGGGTTGIVYSSNSGRYTKIGNKVTVTGAISISSKGSSTGAAVITGLPFSISGGSQSWSAASLWINQINFANQIQARGVPTLTTIELWEVTESGNISGITNTDFTNSSEVILSFTYFV